MLTVSLPFTLESIPTLCQDEATDGTRSDRLATAEREELTALRREVRDLRRANEILKAASVFFARELDQPRPR